MAETPTPLPEFPPVPYERIDAYQKVLATNPVLVIKIGEQRIRTGVAPDLSFIAGGEETSLLLSRQISAERVNVIVDNLLSHLNLATTGERDGTDSFYYAHSTYAVDYFNKDFPSFQITPNKDARLNRIEVITMNRDREGVLHTEPVFYLQREGIVGDSAYNLASFRFFDRHPALTRFVAAYAYLGFPSPFLTHQV